MSMNPTPDVATDVNTESGALLEATFTGEATFAALYAAEAFLERAGFSAGSGSAGQPTAFMFGDWLVAKWKNLTTTERNNVHGTMTGDRRNGPVTLRLTAKCPPDGLAAFAAARSQVLS